MQITYKMSAFITSLSGLASVYITNYVNTGNRNTDTAIISTLILVVGFILNSLHHLFSQKHIRNRIRSWWYRPKSLTDFNDNNYELDTYDELQPGNSNIIYAIRRYVSYDHFTLLKEEIFSKKRYNIITDSNTSSHQPLYTTIEVQTYYPIGFYKGHFVYFRYMNNYHDKKYIGLFSKSTEALIFGNQYIDDIVKNTKTLSDEIEIHNAVLSPDNTKITFEKTGTINQKRIFDTLYYDQKQELYDLLLKFQKGCMYPEKLSLDNKIGILLHGPPGTGKTGTISAIANMLGRPILNVNLTEIILAGKVKDILNGTNYKKYVIVIDEIDHMIKLSTDTLLRDRVTEEKPQPKQDWASLLAVAEGEERQKVLELIKGSMTKEKAKHQFDFATFLQLMDGLEDATGRVIIFCTNNPRVLEETYPALFRPGRIDIKLCLGHCSTQMFEDILGASLSLDDKGREKVRKANLPLHTWTPLQVINTALLHKTLDKTLQVLKIK